MNRFLLLLAAASITGAAGAQTPVLTSFTVGNDSFANGMSRNAKWATYQKQAGEESYTGEVQVVDLTTGKFISYTPAKIYDYLGKEVSTSGLICQPFGVSDDGKTIFGSVNGYPAYFTVDDLTWRCLSMGGAYENRSYSGAVYGMSADGSLMAGWFSGEALTDLFSALWKNGEIVELPGLPTYRDMFDLSIIDNIDYQEQKGSTPNYTFRSLSADGTKLLLGIDHNRPNWGCSYGIYDLTTDKFSFILADADIYGHSFTDSAYMSANGEWATGNMNFIGADINGYDDSDGVYRYHIPTGTLEVFNDLQSRDLLATAIDNNGTILASSPASQPIRTLLVRCGNLWVELDKILAQKYGIDFQSKTEFDTTGYAIGVSADNKSILAQAEFRGGAYALTLPVDFATAADGVSLLTEYAVSPAPGKNFSALKKMNIRFGYAVVPVDGASVIVTDADGKEAGKSVKLTPVSVQNTVYTVEFPDIDLADGKTYTVTVPEGSFVVDGTNMGNPEIKVSYVGRADTPVKATGIDPQDGALINVFSFNAPVTLTFDTELSLSTAVTPKLYEEGKSEAVCNLSVTVDGNRLVVYPASERRLAKDHKYRVEIPANIVADLSGNGFNEAISINYEGAFVPTLSSDPARPFFEDFSSPNEALYNFLLIDGDGLNPTESMQGFGFDAVNTPWNFSIRDENSTDYCAGSHSQYSPAGQSDDWMLIPQLKLNDADYYLTFKGQSFSKAKTDKLRIVVWEYDDVIGSLDQEMLAKIKDEAKTLGEITLVPSATEGLLEGSWKEYEFPLADYAGKNVYIGFVNENRNQSLVFLDDIAVEYRGVYTMSVATEPNLIEAKSTKVVAHIDVNAAGPFNSLEATVSVPKLEYKKTVKADNLALTAGSSYEVEFTDVPLVEGEVNTFTVSATLDNLTQSYKGQVTNHAFEITRRVMVEEGTGMWCGNCPLGEIAIEHLETTMPESVSVISIHNGDALAYQDYDQTLALGGYPNGRVNRSNDVVAPLYNSPEAGDFVFTSPTGDQSFMDFVLRDLSEPTEGMIKVFNPIHFSADKKVEMKINTRYSVTRDNTAYSIFIAVLEDGLQGVQTNYYSNSTSETAAWWAAQPGKLRYTYNNVARSLPAGFYGTTGLIPAYVKSGLNYDATVMFDVPFNIENTDNMHFVVALLDATTGKVINSTLVRDYEVDDRAGQSSVENIADATIIPSVSVTGGKILVSGEADAEVYDLNGMRVRNENLAKGIYLVRKVMADGKVFNDRVLVK
ncbi:MAG: Omp28-related outer membrane protein [Bacteroides sp.]|nr:Omp28-related outer membrane protein [Bacteroides sp.]